MDVALSTDDAALDRLEPEWRALWDADPHASIFHTPEYARVSWQTELGADRELRIVELRRDGALVGLATMAIDPDRTLRFLGNAQVTDYLGPMSAPADRDEVATDLVRAIAGRDDWVVAELDCLPCDSGWPDTLARAGKDVGFEVEQHRQDVCPRVALAGSYDAYLEALPGKLRHEIKRKARRLEREAGPYTVRLTEPDRLRADLDVFYEMHRDSEGHKGKFMHEQMTTFFDRLCEAFQRRGWLRLAWLEIDARPWAAILSFSERGIYNVYNSAFDHTKRELAPGMVLAAETIRMAAEEGCHTYDFLRGDEAYKYRLGAVDEPVVRVGFRRE